MDLGERLAVFGSVAGCVFLAVGPGVFIGRSAGRSAGESDSLRDWEELVSDMAGKGTKPMLKNC